jgi:hypothetical protein
MSSEISDSVPNGVAPLCVRRNTRPISHCKSICRFCQSASPPARFALSKVTEERKGDVWRKVAEEAARNYGTANGMIKMDNESLCIVGTRP